MLEQKTIRSSLSKYQITDLFLRSSIHKPVIMYNTCLVLRLRMQDATLFRCTQKLCKFEQMENLLAEIEKCRLRPSLRFDATSQSGSEP